MTEPAWVQFFRVHGWVKTTPFDATTVAALQAWVTDISAWPDNNGAWLHYREATAAGPKLCRTENIIPYHPELRALLTQGVLLEQASALLGETAVLYKEKINYKLAGGAGYAAHQDAPAYRFVDVHVSCMIAIDAATPENGGLEVVSGHHQALLPTNSRGCIDEGWVAQATWQPVAVMPGEVLWFHSLTPHKSGPNLSSTDRRAIYPTYNALREGDLRAAYYRQKLEEFKLKPTSGQVQVSLIGDFQGVPV